MAQARYRVSKDRPRLVTLGPMQLEGILTVPEPVMGLVIFAHGSGSSRSSPRNQHVAESLARRGLGTLLFDLLTEPEQHLDNQTRKLRFDIELLSGRLVKVIDWIGREDCTYRPVWVHRPWDSAE